MMTYRQALAELSNSQKPRRGVSLYTRYVNRPLGRALAAACYLIKLTPNQVTLASAVITGFGLLVLLSAEPTVWRAAIVAGLLIFGFALDSADGQVARLTGRGSLAGEWLDHVVDSAKVVAVHGSVLITMYRFFDVGAVFGLLPLGFLLVGVVTFFGGELHRLLVAARKDAPSSTPRSASLISAVGLLPADYGVLAVSFALIGWPPAFTVVYGLLFVFNAVVMVLLLAKWFRSLEALSR